jgi:hypothetical protein
MKIETPAMDTCPQCHSAKMAHHACPACGYYAVEKQSKLKLTKEDLLKPDSQLRLFTSYPILLLPDSGLF